MGTAKKANLKVIIPVACVAVLLAAAAFVYFFFWRSPELTIGRAFASVGDEIEKRLENTPLEIFGRLSDSLEEGSVTVDFGLSTMATDTRGSITLHSDAQRREYALTGSVGEYGMAAGLLGDDFNFDFDIYVNKERIAARLSQLDDNFYGFSYATFRDDFRSLANLIGLGRSEIDEVADAIEMFSDLLNMDVDSDVLDSQYTDLFKELLKKAESGSSRVEISSSGRSHSVNKIEYKITAEMILDVLEEFLDIFENDESIRSTLTAIDGAVAFDDMFNEMRSELRSIARDLKGEIVVAFFVGSGDRLYRIETDIDIGVDWDMASAGIVIDFGDSAHDLWTMEMSARMGGVRATFTFEWEMYESTRGGETIFRMATDFAWSETKAELIIEWTDRGDFEVIFDDDWSRNTLLSGRYTSDRDSFSLVIDDPFGGSFWGESLDLEISGTTGRNPVQQITFINIADWGQSLLDNLEGLFNIGGSLMDIIDSPGIGVPGPTPVPPAPDVPVAGNPATAADLIGTWQFHDGRYTYFFWSSDFVEFTADGSVYSSDEREYATWSLQGSTLTVTAEYSEYVFTVSMSNGLLAITDSDGDTGYFSKTG